MQSIKIYETKMGLNRSDLPYSISMKNSLTSYYSNSLMDKTIYTLVVNKVPEKANLSLVELLELPTYMISSIVNGVIAADKAAVGGFNGDSLKNELEELGKAKIELEEHTKTKMPS